MKINRINNRKSDNISAGENSETGLAKESQENIAEKEESRSGGQMGIASTQPASAIDNIEILPAESGAERQAAGSENGDALSDIDDDEIYGSNYSQYDDDTLDVTGNEQLALSEDDNYSSLPSPSSNRLPTPSGYRDSLHLYLKEIGRFPLLKPEEEQELTKRVHEKNDPDAAFRLISSHLRLVVRIAMDFQRRWMQNVLDLVQEGNVGLVRAVNKFDPSKGIKFSYYASFWIRAYILKFIMDNWRMVKIGTTQVQRKLFYNLNRERQKLIAQGFDPDAAMLSERLGVSEEQINEMDQRLASTDMSLNAHVGDEEGNATRMDFLPAIGPGIEDRIASEEMTTHIREQLQRLMPLLSEKEQFILNNRVLSDDPMTLREIGERYNVTRERVRQLEARLLEKICKHMTIDIKDFSDEWIRS